MRWSLMRKRATLLAVAVASGALVAATGGAATAQASTVTTKSLGQFSPTFAGPAATGCASGCSLLSGPSTGFSTGSSASASQAAPNGQAGADSAHAMPARNARSHAGSSGTIAPSTAQPTNLAMPSVSCPGSGCDRVSTSAGGAVGVKGLNAVDSSLHTANIFKNVEPPDQGLCAGNGSVIETNNIGEMLIFDTALNRQSSPISLDTVMGLASKGWSSGGDPSCLYDSSNGGHWIITQIVSASTEASGGAFVGCFAAVANTCYEGIAVSQGSSPFGPYNVYFQNANYNPSEPGSPYQLNDFAKISVTRDAFLMFYDEFPLRGHGLGGGFFNGAQEFAFTKSALEQGLPVTGSNGRPNASFNVAIESMGLIPTPDGTCASSSNEANFPGVTCWTAVIPAQPADAGQYDNRSGGSGFMMDTLDFNSFFGGLQTSGDNRIAVWAWTGLANLTSNRCNRCDEIQFSGQLFSGVETYNDPENALGVGFLGLQKAGPIPLGDQCGAAGLTGNPPQATSCPEGGLNTNGDFMTQVSQAQGQLWGSTPTGISQAFKHGSEMHVGVAYWVVGTGSFDATGQFSLTNQGYVSAAHADLEMAAVAGQGSDGNGGAIMVFTLNGNAGDKGGFFPSTAYGRLTATSNGLLESVINIADAGQSPQDGFTEYQGYPGPTRPRWGDYSWAIFLPGSGGRIYFANEYIQYPNCTPPAFVLHAIGTCGGTRNSLTNWGTSVNYVVP
jgi:hypothetical protein